MIQKNLIIISGTEPRILCSEVIRKNNSSMTQLSVYKQHSTEVKVVKYRVSGILTMVSGATH